MQGGAVSIVVVVGPLCLLRKAGREVYKAFFFGEVARPEGIGLVMGGRRGEGGIV